MWGFPKARTITEWHCLSNEDNVSWSSLAWGCLDGPGSTPGSFIVLKHIGNVDFYVMGDGPAKRPLGK